MARKEGLALAPILRFQWKLSVTVFLLGLLIAFWVCFFKLDQHIMACKERVNLPLFTPQFQLLRLLPTLQSLKVSPLCEFSINGFHYFRTLRVGLICSLQIQPEVWLHLEDVLKCGEDMHSLSRPQNVFWRVTSGLCFFWGGGGRFETMFSKLFGHLRLCITSTGFWTSYGDNQSPRQVHRSDMPWSDDFIRCGFWHL